MELMLREGWVTTRAFKGLGWVAERLGRLLDGVYSEAWAQRRIRDALGSHGDEVLERLNSYPCLRTQVLRTLCAIATDHPMDTLIYTMSVPSPIMARGTKSDPIRIPAIFNDLADINLLVQGKTIGCGEVLTSVLFGCDVKGFPGKKYDVELEGAPLHIKDHRNDDSTFLSSAGDKAETDWRDTDVFVFLKAQGFNINRFGCDELKDNEAFEAAISRRYGMGLYDAASAFQDDLDRVIRESNLMGDAPGFLILKRDGVGLYYEFVGKDQIYFYSTTNNGQVKICERPNRFFNAITHRQNEQARLMHEEALRRDKERAKEQAKKDREARKRAESDLKKNVRIAAAKARVEAKEQARADARRKRDEEAAAALIATLNTYHAVLAHGPRSWKDLAQRVSNLMGRSISVESLRKTLHTASSKGIPYTEFVRMPKGRSIYDHPPMQLSKDDYERLLLEMRGEREAG